MKVCREIDFEDMPHILRCEALKKWIQAEDYQRTAVWELVNDTFCSPRKDGSIPIPTESEINDFVWFNCDEIFYPDEDDYDED